ncbi:MAG: hypothetical protein IKJ65_02435 [Clostridia bacterium]|nr:hypothetical protein [Clostridia bacterium]
MNTTKSMVIKNLTMHLTMMIFSMLVSFVGKPIIGIIMSLAVYFIYIFMMYADGAERGERACTLSATVKKLEDEGKSVDEKMKKQMFEKKKAIKAFVISALPLVLLAVVNVLFAEKSGIHENFLGTITRIVFLPCAWLTRIFTELVGWNIDGALELSRNLFQTIEYSGINFMTAAETLNNTQPLIVAYNAQYIMILRLLFIPFSVIPASAMMIGYLRGPVFREKKLKEIEEGSRKKRKKLKVNKKTKTRVVRPEV